MKFLIELFSEYLEILLNTSGLFQYYAKSVVETFIVKNLIKFKCALLSIKLVSKAVLNCVS